MELSMWDDGVPTALKQWANAVVTEALRRRVLSRPGACAKCGATKWVLHAHHRDYMKPLDVIWLCPKHHHEAHGWRQNPSEIELTRRFREAMDGHGYTYVARHLGVSGGTVRSWVAGRSRVKAEAIEIVESLRPEGEQRERDTMAYYLKKWRLDRRERTKRKGKVGA